jgi:futalosine hydrolase
MQIKNFCKGNNSAGMWMIIDICPMDILLTAATTFEIAQTGQYLVDRENKTGAHHLNILITGIGGVSTTYFLLDEFKKKRPSLIIQAGISGSFLPGAIGDVLTIAEDRFADLGVEEQSNFKTIFDLGLADADASPFKNGALSNPYTRLLALTGLPQVNALSVNEISTDPERIRWHQQNGAPVVETMEGAAFHYVCLLEKIPFIQLRAVSNMVGERDKTKWRIADSIDALNQQLIALINKLAHVDETYFRI